MFLGMKKIMWKEKMFYGPWHPPKNNWPWLWGYSPWDMPNQQRDIVKITGCHSVLQNSINTAEYSLMLNSFCSPKQPITILRTHLKPRLHHWRLYYSLHPLTPKISIEILLTVCHIVLEMLVWRIWSWSN